MTCFVCGSSQSESHFGGISCRACAAFFRRYFNSKKFIIGCSCKTKSHNSHPCRSCRVAKCFAVGMTPKKICAQRDPHGASIKKVDQNGHSKLQAYSPMMTCLSSKDTTNITSTVPNFSIFESKRIEMFEKFGQQNVFAFSCLTKNDLCLASELVSEVFPEFGQLPTMDRTSLLNSFMLKVWQIEPALDHVANRVEYRKMEEMDIQNVMFPFFNDSFEKGAEMTEQEIWRTFGPHWTYFYERVIEPITALNLDQIEMMAIVWILFFDHAYITMSHKSTDLCWNIRKVIHRELKNYISEKITDLELAENRFMELLEVPLIVERGERKFHEEIIICELNRIRFHDDFKAIVKKQRI